MGKDQPLELEDNVVWLEEPGNLDYVREISWDVVDPYQIPPLLAEGYRMIAFTRLVPGLKKEEWKNYHRRYFELRPTDRDSDPNGAYAPGRCPAEAVDPSTIIPGISGRKTSQCKRGR
ncbi:MAG: DUF6009 family protein [Cyanophyceae cyanobacterium]